MRSVLRSLTGSTEPAIRRVNILPAKGMEPAFITVYFRDVEAAHEGYSKLLGGISNDPRTRLDIHSDMPTLTYPVI